MKKMNNYEAPKAEVIELNVNRDLMMTVSGQTMLDTSDSTFMS